MTPYDPIHVAHSCTIDMQTLDDHILHYKNTVVDHNNTWKMKHLSLKSRPSIRAVLAVKQSMRGGSSRSRVDKDKECNGLELVTFENFCDNVRFPNCMSHLLRIRCYLLACQSHQFDFKMYTTKFVSEDIAQVTPSIPCM
jgi:hypothetical protein